ncbi:MAG: tRNA (adenine-N1)-methyltransferase [Actinomycetia bacterium]|nr:tRNA (adenine-N1)-methyltransferase [Actinomycetes bacterium]
MTEDTPTHRPFGAEEMALLIDGKGRRFLVLLHPTRRFEYHMGVVPHTDIIGQPEGTLLRSSSGSRLRLLRPRLADFILKMKRGAQVVYPKDIGPILMWADIAPGMTVVEGGTGSGALAMALARAVGRGGRVVTAEIRDDHASHARKMIKRWFGEIPVQLELYRGPVEDAISEVAPDRVVLDIPEPWHAAKVAAASQPPGAVFCSYLPTVPQVQKLVEVMKSSGGFCETEIFETLHREWNVYGLSVRPRHQMVGHTGFVVVSRVKRPDRRVAPPQTPSE